MKKLDHLTPEQIRVTQDCGTEPAFRNLYWNHKMPGIYVDVVDGTPLFSSSDKFDSGTGWPSFSKALTENAVQEFNDQSHGMIRIEVKSKKASSHLGHLFPDGPAPSGLRYCINSAALRFIPIQDLKKEGFGEYLFLFEKELNAETAILAGGCFWGLEHLFKSLKGVLTTIVGYTGGITSNPTYEKLKEKETYHAEAVKILFDPSDLSYDHLLLYFFKIHDPTTLNRQGNDKGSSYRSIIFFRDSVQKKTAEEVIRRVNESKAWKNPIVTEIKEEGPFWKAEDEHQNYLDRYPDGYTCHYLRNIQF